MGFAVRVSGPVRQRRTGLQDLIEETSARRGTRHRCGHALRASMHQRIMITTFLVLAVGVLVAIEANEAHAEAATSWPALASGALQDNSFLIEEAYNQEAGVVQHIFSITNDEDTGDWTGNFTQEWPVPDQRHQLSFTLPFTFADEPGETSGIGDLLLNYRYQLLTEQGHRPAVAPRLSLILPSGDYHRDLGTGSVGLQFSLPVSRQFNNFFAGHLNLGTTIIPAARVAGEAGRTEQLISGNGGASLIWEPVDAVNFLAEFVVSRDGEVADSGVVHRTHATFNPGTRIAWNLPASVQVVAGVSAPIGLTSDTSDFGVLLYLSVEHAFTSAASADRQW